MGILLYFLGTIINNRKKGFSFTQKNAIVVSNKSSLANVLVMKFLLRNLGLSFVITIKIFLKVCFR